MPDSTTPAQTTPVFTPTKGATISPTDILVPPTASASDPSVFDGDLRGAIQMLAQIMAFEAQRLNIEPTSSTQQGDSTSFRVNKFLQLDPPVFTDDGTLSYQGRLCVPDVDSLRERIMIEAHHSMYSVHLGSIKISHDLKEVYCWNYMKRNVADFVAKCSNCKQVKAKHQRLGGLAQNIEIPMWK
ncbi:uncharacterized protein LOC142176158 [Nicotiana tabacum]|uniref:Uncharacterized protein LOC142176158 n=1 Tax=Nicotiana tabacum TaxID=4097 RepID=A0AC58TQ67_TOBAC